MQLCSIAFADTVNLTIRKTTSPRQKSWRAQQMLHLSGLVMKPRPCSQPKGKRRREYSVLTFWQPARLESFMATTRTLKETSHMSSVNYPNTGLAH